MKTKQLGAKAKRYMWGYLFIAPALLGTICLYIGPVLQTIYLSFTEAKGFGEPAFAGLKNYGRLFGDGEVFRALGNTSVYVLLTVPVGVFLSLFVAVLLNAGIKAKGIFRTVYFLPVISAPVAVSLVWKWLYNREYGLINNILSTVGIVGPNWLGDKNLVIFSIALVGIWSMLGYNMVILLAGLQEIPQTLYEAAEIDGAGPFTRFFRITIPMVSPTLFFVVVTATISALQVFDFVYMMVDRAGPAFKSAETVVFLFYRYTFENYNRGYGSAIAIFLFVIVLVLTLFQMQWQKKWVHYN